MVAEREEDEDECPAGGSPVMEGDESPVIECPVLVTDRLVLRQPHEDDIPELAQLANSRKIADMLGRMPHPYGEAEACAFVESAGRNGVAGCTYAVTLAESGAFIGCAGLHGARQGLELGYWIGEPWWNRGYATEVAHALVDLTFRASALDRLHVSCRLINTASRRVIHKCGFQYAGQGMMDSLSGGRVAVERYVLDRSTWASLRSWGRM